ncbi:IclR family transcriptional regulator C-terminal domain-containing protein [Nocardia sp. NPDC059691]|uniref:IclR family transcriptional regulator domain-containing protein n=1 Tax=Nocardia sp. NPDC059691 TaxID=3346908 RepID=UPI0036A66892
MRESSNPPAAPGWHPRGPDPSWLPPQTLDRKPGSASRHPVGQRRHSRGALSARVGEQRPLHPSTAGRCFLAYSDPDFQQNYLTRHIDEPDIRARICNEPARIARDGVAFADPRVTPDLGCIHVPLFRNGMHVASRRSRGRSRESSPGSRSSPRASQPRRGASRTGWTPSGKPALLEPYRFHLLHSLGSRYVVRRRCRRAVRPRCTGSAISDSQECLTVTREESCPG